MKRLPPAHPYLFALASLLYLYPATAVIVSPLQVGRPLIVEWLVIALLTVVLYRIVHDRQIVAILLSIFVLGFFSSPSYFYAAGRVSVALLLLWWLISFLRKRKLEARHIGILLNVSSGLLVLIYFARLIPLFAQVPWLQYQQAVSSAQDQALIQDSPAIKPDIYYVVLDGYARSDILEELYGYDNSAFISYLEDKGFVVPAESRSNYPKTALSITSTLNMDYVSTLTPGLDDSVFWWLMTPLIDHSRVRASLERAGYETVSIATDWGITNNSTTDRYFKPSPVYLNDFESYLFAITPLKTLTGGLKNIAFIPSFAAHRELVKYNFDVLKDIPEYSGPKFIYAHIISPHPPFVFDQDGHALDPGYPFSFNDANDFPGTDSEYRRAYIAQVEFVNRQLQETIDEIIAKSATPPIIILQADHGPGMLTDFRTSEKTCLRERFSPFAAYYFPGLEEESVPENISAVNVFRLVFNHYFGAGLPMLENRHYYFKDTVYLFKTEDVTSRVDETCELSR